jgi:two-component system sensor histidine kinase QseC
MPEQRTVHSIKRRLLIILLMTTVIAWGATLLLSYHDTHHELDELLDAYLAQSASLLMLQVGHEVEEVDTEHAPQLHRYGRKVVFQIWEDGRQLRLHSANAPNIHLSTQNDGYSDTVVGMEPWRVFSVWDQERRYLVQVGERREVRDELAKTIAQNLAQPLLVALPVLGLLIWFGVARGLRPLTTLGHQVEQRHSDNLAPLEAAAVPDEVAPLVAGLNRLFARVSASLDNERRFTADAAHELRTPLAAIKTQAQVARGATNDEERRRALDNVAAGCDRAAHLVQQLLTLARLEPEQTRQFERCDLRAIAAATIAELAPAAFDKGIDIQLDEGAPVEVPCEAALVGILMRNLIDNAVRYSPHNGVVRVAVTEAGSEAEFSVVDQGPCIAPEQRALVWGRFYRVLGSGEAGSGLGLSIVKRIADLHGAKATLGDCSGGKGMRVSIVFPV